MKPTIDQLINALKICAEEEPQPTFPCEKCYLYPFSNAGRMSSGRTCFMHLAFDVIDVLREKRGQE